MHVTHQSACDSRKLGGTASLRPFVWMKAFLFLEGFTLKLPPRESLPWNPIPQKHVYVSASKGAGKLFPCQGVGQRPTKKGF